VPKPVVIPIKPLTAWSFSRYSDYKRCPAKFKYKHLEKRPEPGSAALDRGAMIHTLAERYLKGLIVRLPPELAAFEDEFKELRKLYKKDKSKFVVEDNWAFTKEWGRTTSTDWANCWLRIKLDFAQLITPTFMKVRDWKTGKLRDELHEEYLEQLELYALAALMLFPDLEVVEPELDYLDLGLIYPDPDKGEPLRYYRSDVERLRKTWEKRVAPMFKDKRFAPRPNDKCNWCHYRAENKGPCKY
jgi:RecB family exonuclease